MIDKAEGIKLFRSKYKVDTNNVNFNRKLGLFGTLGLLQDIAGEHAGVLGFGYEDMVRDGYFWVLTQQKLRMKKWAKWHDEVEVATWALPLDGFRAYREFEIFIDGEKIGDCSTTWMILDAKTHRPRVPDFTDMHKLVRDNYSLEFRAGKVILPEHMSEAARFTVYNSDIDMNKHVNNTRYTKWVLDTIPMKYHTSVELREFEINFLNQTFLGDEIIIEKSDPIVSDNGSTDSYFSGKRVIDNKLVFASKLTFDEIR